MFKMAYLQQKLAPISFQTSLVLLNFNLGIDSVAIALWDSISTLGDMV